MKGMKELRRIYISANEFKVEDLTPLLDLENLQYVHINSWASDKEELSDDMRLQIEEVKAKRPEMTVSIWE